MTDDAEVWVVEDGTPFRRSCARVRAALAAGNVVALSGAADEALAAERDTRTDFCTMLALFASFAAVVIEDGRSDVLPMIDAAVRKLAVIAHGRPDQG